MTRRHHGRIIDTRIRVQTTPQRAWEAWADPQQIANWFVDRAEGVAAPGQVMTWFFDTFKYQQPVPVLEAEPGRSFVIGSGDAPGPQGLPYLMEITIRRDGEETVVRLVNSGFSEDARFDDEYEGVASGWSMALATMKHWLERYPARSRQHRLVMEPAAYAGERLRPLFHSAQGRQQWLDSRLPAAGPVLADTGREVLLAWDEQQGVLGLKAFRMGPQQMLALDVSRWADEGADLDELASACTRALQRLRQEVTAS